jgi:predicted site-specific integrase-resolvase
MSKNKGIGQAAMKAGMDKKTARRYIVAGKLPSMMKKPRWWRTVDGNLNPSGSDGRGRIGRNVAIRAPT